MRKTTVVLRVVAVVGLIACAAGIPGDASETAAHGPIAVVEM